LQAREHAPTPPSIVFMFGLGMNPSRSLGVRQAAPRLEHDKI
jgi:hypothetical protein